MLLALLFLKHLVILKVASDFGFNQNVPCKAASADGNAALMHSLLCFSFIIMIFYYGLMVHITETRAQKLIGYTSAHVTETMFAHDHHWEEQSSLSSPQL